MPEGPDLRVRFGLRSRARRVTKLDEAPLCARQGPNADARVSREGREELVVNQHPISQEVTRQKQDPHANRTDGTDKLLALMNLEIWTRMYVDRRTPEDVTAELEGMLV